MEKSPLPQQEKKDYFFKLRSFTEIIAKTSVLVPSDFCPYYSNFGDRQFSLDHV